MRKNNVKRAIKKVSKSAVKNPNTAITTTAVVGAFSVFGMVEAGLIIKNKAKVKLEEIKSKKENKKNKDNANNNNDNSAATEPQQPQQPQQSVAEDEAENNNEGAEA